MCVRGLEKGGRAGRGVNGVGIAFERHFWHHLGARKRIRNLAAVLNGQFQTVNGRAGSVETGT
jgi:hypothetical protein